VKGIRENKTNTGNFLEKEKNELVVFSGKITTTIKRWLSFVSLSLLFLRCEPPYGQKGMLGNGVFLASCYQQLPSLCKREGIPSIAVGASIHIFYEPNDYSPWIKNTEAEAVSKKLFSKPAWSDFYIGDSKVLYDYIILVTSMNIEKLKILRGSDCSFEEDEVLVEPIEVGCSRSSNYGYCNYDTYIVPVGYSGEYLLGVGDWVGHVEPEVAVVFFQGNAISLLARNLTDDKINARLTITLRNTLKSWDFELLVCPGFELA